MNLILKYQYLYLVVLILFCANITNNAIAATLVFSDDFEQSKAGQPPTPFPSANRSTGSWGKCSGNCLTVTSEQARSGSKSLKSYLSRSESKTPNRTEAVPRNEIAKQTKFGEHYWYGFSVFIPNHHIPDTSQDLVFQLHAHLCCGRGGPPISLIVHGTDWKIPVKWNTDRNGNKDSRGFGSRWFTIGPYNTGVWTDWVFHVKYSWRNDGVVEVWKNGKKVMSYNGPNAYNDVGAAPHPTMGVYKPAWGKAASIKFKPGITSRTYYHDNIRIYKGADVKFSDVDPAQNRSGSPNGIEPPQNIKIISKN